MGLAVGAVAIFPCAAGLCSFFSFCFAQSSHSAGMISQGGGPIGPLSAITHSPLLHELVDDWVKLKETY